MVEAMDTGVGQILRALQRLGVADNTLVIFTNDNGGEWLSEQEGCAIASGQSTKEACACRRSSGGRAVSRPAASHQPAITFDWSATMLSAAGMMPPASCRDQPGADSRGPAAESSFFLARRAQQPESARRPARRLKLIVDANHTIVFNVRQDGRARRPHQRTARHCPSIASAAGRLEDEVNAEQRATEPEQAEQKPRTRASG